MESFGLSNLRKLPLARAQRMHLRPAQQTSIHDAANGGFPPYLLVALREA